MRLKKKNKGAFGLDEIGLFIVFTAAVLALGFLIGSKVTEKSQYHIHFYKCLPEAEPEEIEPV